jgi:cytidyltransferase-like protein
VASRRVVAVAGRFQPLHWGHFEYLVEASRRGDHLRVGITNPTAEAVRVSAANPRRSRPDANPFSYLQREEMVRRTLTGYCPSVDFSTVPCDLRSPALVRESLGECDLVAVTVYDAWGDEKVGLFQEAGYRVEVMWRRVEKIVTGSQVRSRILADEPWRHLVPGGTAEVVEENLDRRMSASVPGRR